MIPPHLMLPEGYSAVHPGPQHKHHPHWGPPAAHASLSALCWHRENTVPAHGARLPTQAVPPRWFTLQDVELLEDDVDAMRILFHADGEGVPREAVQMTTAPLDELLTVLALDTPTLTANFRQVQALQLRLPSCLNPARQQACHTWAQMQQACARTACELCMRYTSEHDPALKHGLCSAAAVKLPDIKTQDEQACQGLD